MSEPTEREWLEGVYPGAQEEHEQRRSSIEQALDYFEQEWQLNGRPYLWDAGEAMRLRPVAFAALKAHLSCLDPSPEMVEGFQQSCRENPRVWMLFPNAVVKEALAAALLAAQEDQA